MRTVFYRSGGRDGDGVSRRGFLRAGGLAIGGVTLADCLRLQAADGGRDHWPNAGSVLFSGGGLKMGQYVGSTNATGEFPVTRAYTPQNIPATLYHVLGIPPAATIADHNGRPQFVLEDRDPVKELI